MVCWRGAVCHSLRITRNRDKIEQRYANNGKGKLEFDTRCVYGIECCYEIQIRNLTVTDTSVSTDWGIKQRSIGKELEPFKRPCFLIQP
jgi:hypothetical protein